MSSKTKFYILFFGSIIFAFWLFSDLLGTGYYKTPEASLADQNGEDSVKTIISTIQKNDDAFIFYVSRDNALMSVSLKSEIVNSTVGYKMLMIGKTPYVHDIKQNDVVPNQMCISSGGTYILYGTTKSSLISNVKINGQKPEIGTYEVDGEEYIFWYIFSTYDEYHKDIEVTYE